MINDYASLMRRKRGVSDGVAPSPGDGSEIHGWREHAGSTVILLIDGSLSRFVVFSALRGISVTGEAGWGRETNHGRRRKGRTSRYATPNRLCGFQLDSRGVGVWLPAKGQFNIGNSGLHIF